MLTKFDLGGCNCVPCACAPCALPAADLVLTITNSHRPPVSGPVSGAVRYNGALLGPCTWFSDCINVPGQTGSMMQMSISCTGGCTGVNILQYLGGTCVGAPVASYYWDSPLNCSGLTGTFLTLSSFTCSPLSVVWTSGSFTWTLTP